MSLLFLRVAMSSNFLATIWWWAPPIKSGHTFLTYLRKSSRHSFVSSSWASLNSSFNRRSVISGVSARSMSAKIRFYFALFTTALPAYFYLFHLSMTVVKFTDFLHRFIQRNPAMRLMSAIPAMSHRHVSFCAYTSSGFLPHAS